MGDILQTETHSLTRQMSLLVENKPWLERNFVRIIYILTYYMLSITVSVFNAHIIGRHRYNFSFPLFISGTSALVQFFYALSSLWFLGVLGPTLSRITLGQFAWAILPCAIASSLDIGISNSAFKFVSLSFYIMVKSSSPIFVLLCAFALGLEKPSVPLLSIMGVIGSGVLMTVWSDTKFNVVGFLIVLSAAMLSGIRWSLTQIIIEEADQTDDARKLVTSGPLATILYLAPIAFILMAGLSGIIEGFDEIYYSKNFATWLQTAKSFGIIWIAGTLTFLLILVEYKVVQETSVLTFSVAGILKEVALIIISMIIFGDRLLPINYLGIIISISGICSYNYLRYLKKKKQTSENPKSPSILPVADYELVPTQTVEPLSGFVTQRQDQHPPKEPNTLLLSDDSRISSSTIAALEAQLTPSHLELIKRRLKRLMKPFAPRLYRKNDIVK